MRQHLDNKVVTTRIADEAGVECVPNVLARVDSYETLRRLSGDLGSDLVIQTPFGDSGHTTFFVSDESDWRRYAAEIIREPEVKVMKRIRPRGTAVEACVTRHGTIVAPLMTELVGLRRPHALQGRLVRKRDLRRRVRRRPPPTGPQGDLRDRRASQEEGYRGYFELDFLIDEDSGKLYLGEMNPRITGASSITNHTVFALADAPLFLFHLLEWMDVDYELDVGQLNERWARPENIDTWSQLVIKHTADSVEVLTGAPPTGIWRMDGEGEVRFSRYDTHRRAVESEAEAFFLRISNQGDYRYEGADLGILVTRGRLMDQDFRLNERARTWIRGLKSCFETEGNLTGRSREPGTHRPLARSRYCDLGVRTVL